MKAQHRSIYVDVGDLTYCVHCRILPGRAPAHAGADSPRFMDFGSPPRVQILRILCDRVEVTHDLLWFTRARITELAVSQALADFSRYLRRRRALRRILHPARRRVS